MRRRVAQAVRLNRRHVQRERLLSHGLAIRRRQGIRGQVLGISGFVRLFREVGLRVVGLLRLLRLRDEVGFGIGIGWRFVIVIVGINVRIDIGDEVLARLDGFVKRALGHAVRKQRMIKGFKEFILRGNVIDLAVAVVIGGAFTAIVNSIVSSIINPLVALFYEPSEDGQFGPEITGIYGQSVVFPLGELISAVISFLAVAIVVYFVFVYPMNHLKARAAARAGLSKAEDEPKLPTEQEILVQIRDLLEKQQSTPPRA